MKKRARLIPFVPGGPCDLLTIVGLYRVNRRFGCVAIFTGTSAGRRNVMSEKCGAETSYGWPCENRPLTGKHYCRYHKPPQPKTVEAKCPRCLCKLPLNVGECPRCGKNLELAGGVTR